MLRAPPVVSLTEGSQPIVSRERDRLVEALARTSLVPCSFSSLSRRSSSSTLSNPLLNIFCSCCLRNFFYYLNRLSFNCFSRARLLAASQATSASISSRSSFSIAALIPKKLTTGSAGSHFLPTQTHSPHFFDSEERRYSF